MTDRHLHCGSCGRRFTNDAWPRVCEGCGAITYRNPVPVAVVIQPIGEGMLVVRRGIEPRKGQWVLPGGYMDFGESWQVAAARELHEETGIVAPAEGFRLFTAHSTPNGAEVLLFAVAPTASADVLSGFVPHKEVSEVDVITEPMELGFPLHSAVCAAYFEQRGG